MGLARKQVWTEYLTTIITASFVPLEVYEIVEHGSALKIAAIGVNLAIGVYLVLRLRRDGRWPFHHDSAWTRFAKLFR